MKVEDVALNILESNRNKKYEKKQIEYVLHYIEDNLALLREKISRAEISKYLYYTCLEFNKFSVPSPYVSDNKLFELFSKALNVFEKIEKEANYYDNLSRLKMDYIIWSIFNEISIPHRKSESIDVYKYQEQLLQIIEPKSEYKKEEFQKRKYELEQLIVGYENNNLVTIIETTIPVCPVKEETVIKVNYYELPTKIRLIPLFMQSGQSMISVSEENTAIPMANSQWQDSICKVEISINGLLDSSYSSENLSLPPDNSDAQSPFIHNYLFELLEKISWNIHSKENKIGRWLINPNDIGMIAERIYTNNNKFHFSMISPPNQIVSISVNTRKSTPLIIKDDSILEEKEWFDKCLILAQDKLSLGNTNEAVFWLNVGVEALFEKRTQLICQQIGIDFETFTASNSYWLNAKELVEKHISKEEANKIIWPEVTNGKASWFTIIKNITKKVELRACSKDILKHYSIINKHRNAIFHGVKHSRVNSDTVNKAISSFDWIKNHYVIKSSI